MSATTANGTPLTNGAVAESTTPNIPANELPADELKRRAGLSKRMMAAFGEAVLN